MRQSTSIVSMKAFGEWKLIVDRHYETPTCKILVGEEEALFIVNEGLLQPTTFFAQHGKPKPKTPSQPPQQPEPDPNAPRNAADIVFPDDESQHAAGEDERSSDVVDLTDENADYILRDKFYYSRDAFAILIRHLNDALPPTPNNQDECISLFKAYALAQRYRAEQLQNEIIDALQRFYLQTTIPVSDLIYLINHWGDEVDCFLAGYLIAQAAYEMACDWPKYRGENSEIMELFGSGRKVILERLFQAAMQYGKPTPSSDPARHKRDWRLQTR